MIKKSNGIVWFVIILLAIMVLGFILFWVKDRRIRNIDSFEECANQGYPIMEMYPPICTTPDGRSFTQQLTDEGNKKIIPSTTINN